MSPITPRQAHNTPCHAGPNVLTLHFISLLHVCLCACSRCTFPTSAAATAAEAVIRVIGCCPPAAAHQHARDLVAPILESLQQLCRECVAGSARGVDVGAGDEVARELLVFAVVLRFLDTLPPAGPGQEHPAVAVFGACSATLCRPLFLLPFHSRENLRFVFAAVLA
jgi:hypothetical protein